jgi:hypothetical protein
MTAVTSLSWISTATASCLTRHRPRHGATEATLQRELDRINGLSWTEFCGFIAKHEWRRCLLDESSVAAPNRFDPCA